MLGTYALSTVTSSINKDDEFLDQDITNQVSEDEDAFGSVVLGMSVDSKHDSECAAHRQYYFDRSTEENWSSNDYEFYGTFKEIRRSLDYCYHRNYARERQLFQDSIIQKMISSVIKDRNGYVCTTPTEPWIVFTAGAMGSGKSHTIRRLKELNRFPLLAFVTVDPDEIRRELPEFETYVEINSLSAGEMTRKEAGYIAEILTMAALRKGKNVLVDGSLRDIEWYSQYFQELRRSYPTLKIGILHVTAAQEVTFKRAALRSQLTGRTVPNEVIIQSMEQVPHSVEKLKLLSDYCAELKNDNDVVLVSPTGQSWKEFADIWQQNCLLSPDHKPIPLTNMDSTTRRRIEDSTLSKECIWKLSMSIERDDQCLVDSRESNFL